MQQIDMTLLSVDPTPGDRLFSSSWLLLVQCFDGWFRLDANVSNPHQALALLLEVNGKINGCLQGIDVTESDPPM